MTPVGPIAPSFQLSDQRGNPFRLADYAGRANVLLLFLPAAFTPICTTELPALAALADRFWSEANTIVAAVTVDNAPANREWGRRCNADGVFILSDFYPHGAVSQAYGAWIPAEGISDRATVLVGKDGTVKYSESVGKFGKRSISSLLNIAAAANGTPIAAAGQASAAMPLDLPVLFVTSTCPHCQKVLATIRANKLDDKIVVRDVTADRAAMQDFLRYDTGGNVPALVYKGAVAAGETNVVNAFAAMYG